jgi:hypothetical protein
MKRILFLLLFPCAVSANPGDTACQRLSDAVNNLANRTLSAGDETVLLNALNAAMGGASNATNTTKCTNGLTYLHNAVKQAVIAKKNADQPPANSSEVD